MGLQSPCAEVRGRQLKCSGGVSGVVAKAAHERKAELQFVAHLDARGAIEKDPRT